MAFLLISQACIPSCSPDPLIVLPQPHEVLVEGASLKLKQWCIFSQIHILNHWVVPKASLKSHHCGRAMAEWTWTGLSSYRTSSLKQIVHETFNIKSWEGIKIKGCWACERIQVLVLSNSFKISHFEAEKQTPFPHLLNIITPSKSYVQFRKYNVG